MISELILKWYKKNKRNLVWRKTKNPYKIWVSEIILQQTKISVGTKYYLSFIKKFPNLESLSKGTDKEILKIWEGLGYYSRAINMLKTAKTLVENKKKFPYGKKINFNSIRKGEIIGEHEVKFSSGKEIITLNHEAFDRALYSDGALTASKWLMKKKPGLYSMRDLLNFS